MHAPLKRALTLTLAAATTVALAACSSGATSATSKDKKLDLALVVGTSSDPFYVTMAQGAKAEAAKLNATVHIYGDPTTYSPSVQVPIVNQVLAQRPDGLALVATDPDALQPGVNRAIASGIPVVNVDNSVKDLSKVTAFITGNNQDGGKKAADAMAHAIGYQPGQTYQVVVALTSATTGTNVERLNGFKKQIATKYPDIKIVATGYAQNNSTIANTNVNNWLTAYPDLTGIFAIDGNDASGAAAALQTKGLVGKVKLVGYDAVPSNVTLLKKGVFTALIAQNPAEEGKQAIDDLVKRVRNGSDKGITKLVTLPNITLTPDTSASDLEKYTYKSK